MSLAASGQLIDGDTTILLPCASACDCRLVGGITRQPVAELKSSAHQAIEVGKVGFDLGLQGLVHRSVSDYWPGRGWLCGNLPSRINAHIRTAISSVGRVFSGDSMGQPSTLPWFTNP